MKFPYRILPIHRIPLPLISIRIPTHNGATLHLYCLLDSGADNCYLDADIGEKLGIDVKSGIRLLTKGITGATFESYKHNISFKIDNLEVKTDVYFSYQLGTPYGILGQQGFFDKFKICFDRKNREIEIK